jgi:hypothetical protein
MNAIFECNANTESYEKIKVMQYISVSSGLSVIAVNSGL